MKMNLISKQNTVSLLSGVLSTKRFMRVYTKQPLLLSRIENTEEAINCFASTILQYCTKKERTKFDCSNVGRSFGVVWLLVRKMFLRNYQDEYIRDMKDDAERGRIALMMAKDASPLEKKTSYTQQWYCLGK